MPSLRTPESKEKYREYRKNEESKDVCLLCEKPALEIFKHWKIIENSFPYDLIAKIHHMIVPLRHVMEDDLNKAELDELRVIKESTINKKYDYIIESTTKTISDHFHLHLIISKF